MRLNLQKNPILLSLLAILLSIPLTVYLARQRQELRKKAAPPQEALAECSGTIEVSNSNNRQEFRGTNTFTITITNTGTNAITVNVHDEIWLDTNCNGIADFTECEAVGLNPDNCRWGVTSVEVKQWNGISLSPGESHQLTWSRSDWIPGYCYLHTVFFYSTPLDSSNPCWKGFEQGWQEAQQGNIQFKENQAQFSAYSNLPQLGGTEYGVNTHLDLGGTVSPGQNLEAFKRDIDAMQTDSTKLRLVRLIVFSWDIVKWANTNSIDWKEENLIQIDEAINYANERGFRIIMTLSPWDSSCAWHAPGTENCWNLNYDENAYNDYIRRFYNYLAERWSGKIYIWNPWNEIDHGCFTSYIGECKNSKGIMTGAPPTYATSNEYLNGLNSALAAARVAIKSQDPQALLAVSVGNYPIPVWYFRSIKLFDRIQDNLDILTTSLYPHGTEQRDEMSDVLDYLRHKYNKPVFVMETGAIEQGSGMCSGGLQEPEPRSSTLVSQLNEVNKHAQGVLLYQFRDEDRSPERDCPLFGIRRVDDSKKPSYWAIMDYVDNNGATPTLTPTPTPKPGKAQLTLKIKFQGIVSQKPDQKVKVTLKNGPTFENVNVVSDTSGVYSGTVANITPGTYDIFIKGCAHLQKKFPNINLGTGENSQDFSQTPLLAGDFDNNNLLNLSDISLLLAQYTALQMSSNDNNRKFDLNNDGYISLQDVALLLGNYTQLNVPGEN